VQKQMLNDAFPCPWLCAHITNTAQVLPGAMYANLWLSVYVKSYPK